MEIDSNKRGKARKRFLIESFWLLLIIGSPFIFKLHEYVPSGPDDTFNFLGIEFTKNGFQSVDVHIWFLLGKLIPLYLLTIWFFTCKHWWYHILLIPICMYAFQIFEGIYAQDGVVDTDNVLWLLPVCMVVITFVYFIRLKLFDKYVHGIDLEAMDAELQYYKNKEREQMQKAGIRIPIKEELTTSMEEDLSNETPKRTLNHLMKQLQTAMKSLLSL
jgi:hypothetical protein